MAMIETWLKTDLQHVVRVQSLDGNLFSADNSANRVGVILTDNGRPSNIVGGVSAYLIRPDEATLIISGQSSGNRAWVDLPASSYVKVGPFSLVIKNGTTTIGACTGYIYRTTTDEIVDPGHVIPSIEELLAEIENMRGATRAAEAVIETANTAASNANTKASAANTAAGAANTAAANANEKASAANTAAGAANAAAANADAKASAANTAASAANTAASNADAKATAANTAAANANEKASAANTAASNANAKASAADTAATNANAKASEAATAAGAANTAAGKIDNMTVAANGLNPGSNPTAAISEVSGHKHILFGIPKGNTGATPAISVGNVTTLQPNQQATVELDQSSTPEAPVFNFGIPKGDTGTIQNTYASTLEMSPTDSRKIKSVLDKKAEKDTDAVTGNFASFDANGNPVDSGHKHSDYLTQHQDISGKADKDTDAVTGNFASFDASGNPVDSGNKSSDYIKTINGRRPNPVTGDIVVIEGGGSSTYGAYRIDATIATSDWVLTNGLYRVTITSAAMADIITSNMDGSETWLDDETAMLGETTFTTFGSGSGDGGIYVDTAVLPTASWGLHILLAMNGADVLSDLTGKITQAKDLLGAGIGIVVDGDTATSVVAPGEYAYIKNNTHGLAEGVYYNSSGSSFPVSGGTANNTVFSIPSKGGLNALYGSKVNTSDIVDNLTTNNSAKVLSAAQGYALNNKITLPDSATDVTTLDAIKTHILSLHNNMTNGEIRPDYLNVTANYTGTVFIKQTRYWGTYARINSTQGSITYRSRNGDEVIVGVTNIGTTPVWNIESVALNSKLDIKQNQTWNVYPSESGTRIYFYESSTAATDYGVPTNYCFVVVHWYTATRAVAYAIQWNSTSTGNVWVNNLHQTWQGWKPITGTTVVSPTVVEKDSRLGTPNIVCRRYGNVVYLSVSVSADCSVTSWDRGTNIDLTLSNLPKPVYNATSALYLTTNIFGAQFMTDGTLRFRNTTAANVTSPTTTLVVSFTYITNE